MVFEKSKESGLNGTKLSRMFVAQQAFAKVRPRANHAAVVFRSALDHPRFHSAGSMRIHAELQRNVARHRLRQPTHRVHKADPLNRHLPRLGAAPA
jgi:hypothetical protein